MDTKQKLITMLKIILISIIVGLAAIGFYAVRAVI